MKKTETFVAKTPFGPLSLRVNVLKFRIETLARRLTTNFYRLSHLFMLQFQSIGITDKMAWNDNFCDITSIPRWELNLEPFEC